jgi:teichuronic acid biosynthesis glycosyltransferase TuaC
MDDADIGLQHTSSPEMDRHSPTCADVFAPIRLLTFSTLYPHDGRPNHGIFVENRLRHLVNSGRASSIVVAPVPWFPSTSRKFGNWARNAEAKRCETRGGLSVFHPRYASVPKLGMSIAPAALFAAGVIELRRLKAAGSDFDLIDAHYIYPDGVAAVALGLLFKKPVVLTARGSDITQFPDHAIPRRMIVWAMKNATALISVSAGLKTAMVKLGAPDSKVTVLRNGVDLDAFRMGDPGPIRSRLGVKGKLLLSVGHLIKRKGHHLAIEALARLPDWTLAIVGEGPERKSLAARAVELAVERRVIFCGSQPHDALPAYYAAADLLILASSREGWANVLLEAMACGTAVVASDIPGNSEVVSGLAAGEVVRENTPACFAETINRVFDRKIPRSETRSYAENFSWDATSDGQLAVFRRALHSSDQFESR